MSQAANVAGRCCLLQPSLLFAYVSFFLPPIREAPAYVRLQFRSLHRSHGLLLEVFASLVLESKVVWSHEREAEREKKKCESLATAWAI
jgi:hypothetical protein